MTLELPQLPFLGSANLQLGLLPQVPVASASGFLFFLPTRLPGAWAHPSPLTAGTGRLTALPSWSLITVIQNMPWHHCPKAKEAQALGPSLAWAPKWVLVAWAHGQEVLVFFKGRNFNCDQSGLLDLSLGLALSYTSHLVWKFGAMEWLVAFGDLTKEVLE